MFVFYVLYNPLVFTVAFTMLTLPVQQEMYWLPGNVRPTPKCAKAGSYRVRFLL